MSTIAQAQFSPASGWKVGLIALPVCGRRREQPTDTKRQWAARVVAMASRRYGEPLAAHIARDAEKGLIRTTADMRRRYALRPAVGGGGFAPRRDRAARLDEFLIALTRRPAGRPDLSA